MLSSDRAKFALPSIVARTLRVIAAAAFSLLVISNAIAAESRDQWEEEILLQLSELRKTQGDLVKQVADLQVEVAALRATAKEPTPALSMDLRKKEYPVLGDGSADVAIVEFSDFECPYCLRHYRNTVPLLNQKYIDSGKVKYVFVDFPLSFHANAAPAALAGACAHQQGAFWKMRESLFENQHSLSAPTFQKIADDLHLNANKFNACLKDPKSLAQIQAQAQLGESLGVQGTPAFLVGKIRDGKLVDGELISGAQPMTRFESVLDPLLR